MNDFPQRSAEDDGNQPDENVAPDMAAYSEGEAAGEVVASTTDERSVADGSADGGDESSDAMADNAKELSAASGSVAAEETPVTVGTATTAEPPVVAATPPQPPTGVQPPQPDPEDPEAIWQRLAQGREQLLGELRKIIVGQERVVEELMIVLFAGGHCLLSGAPGLAKTLLIRTLAQIMDLNFKRIQFTPDLMPADITGTEIIDEDPGTGHRELRFVRGPIFANVLLADEINRTPPKTQSALLEAMEEKQVTVAGTTYDLAPPFFVFATQNPIELEGTYPLPEAQLDRFMFKVLVDYLDEDQELAVATQTTSGTSATVEPVFNADDMLRFRRMVRSVPIADAVARYAVRLVQASRPIGGDQGLDFVQQYVAWGAGTRASQYLILAAKTRALLAGRYHVACEDIRAVAHPVLRHRILTNFQADADRVDVTAIIDRLLESIDEPTSGLNR